MMPLEPVTLSFSAALLLGLSFGAGPCNIACLPYLGPVFMSSDQGIRDSWRTLLPFSAGRMTGYGLLGGAAGWAGLWVQDWVNGPWVHWVLGGATILVALSLFWRWRRRPQTRNHHANQTTEEKMSISVSLGPRPPALLPGGLFMMGMGMALNPCAPLTIVVMAAATTASAAAGISLGLGSGVGAVIVPTFIFAFGVAHFSNQIRARLSQWHGALEITGSGSGSDSISGSGWGRGG